MRGLQVKVDMFRQGSGKNAQTFTRYSVHYPPPDFDFRLTRETGLSRTTRLFGAQDVEVGETGFDPAFVTKTDDEGTVEGLARRRPHGSARPYGSRLSRSRTEFR